MEVAIPGNEPRRVIRSAALRAAVKTSASLQWIWQGKPVPPIDFELNFRHAAPAASAPQAEGHAAPWSVSAKVVNPTIADLPPEARAQFQPLTKQFAGATVTFDQSANGAVTPMVVGGAGGPTGGDAARFLAGMLSDALLAFPTTPVGQGALWMTTSRESLLGFETITLRMVRLEALSPEDATFSVTTHRYATSDAMPLTGAPVGAKLVQFAVSSEAKIVAASISPGTRGETGETQASLPRSAEVSTKIELVMTVPDRPNAGLPVRASSTLTLKTP